MIKEENAAAWYSLPPDSLKIVMLLDFYQYNRSCYYIHLVHLT